MVFLYVNKQYLLLVDAIGRYSDRLGPRPKMRSVAYRMRCVYATAEVICKIISHNNENPTTTMTMSTSTHHHCRVPLPSSVSQPASELASHHHHHRHRHYFKQFTTTAAIAATTTTILLLLLLPTTTTTIPIESCKLMRENQLCLRYRSKRM
uniref:Uncharacterized protein n=1 Tax=Glossina pallidipes TaxID=7398 RepID=A0A1B0A248_GLOPL